MPCNNQQSRKYPCRIGKIRHEDYIDGGQTSFRLDSVAPRRARTDRLPARPAAHRPRGQFRSASASNFFGSRMRSGRLGLFIGLSGAAPARREPALDHRMASKRGMNAVQIPAAVPERFLALSRRRRARKSENERNPFRSRKTGRHRPERLQSRQKSGGLERGRPSDRRKSSRTHAIHPRQPGRKGNPTSKNLQGAGRWERALPRRPSRSLLSERS